MKKEQLLADAIDKMMVDEASMIPPRGYLGVSTVSSSECNRKIQYNYQNMPTNPAPLEKEARRNRIFNRGHIFEDYIYELLAQAGFIIQGQESFETQEGMFKGHCDGLIISGKSFANENDEGIQYPCIWEHKSLGDKAFKKISIGGVKGEPRYLKQIALYQAYLNHTNPALFSALNVNTMELYFEFIPFDSALAQTTSDKAVLIIEAIKHNEILPRISADPSHYECKLCEFSEYCWRTQ